MIECESCGANLSLKEDTCPYCGAPNIDAIEHVRMLKYYQDRYHDTRDGLLNEDQEKAPLRTKRIVLTVLIAMFLLTLIINIASYDIREFIDHTDAKMHAKTDIHKVYNYMEQVDALSLANDCWIHDNKNSKASEIREVWNLSHAFISCQETILLIADGNDGYYGGLDRFISSSTYYYGNFYKGYTNLMADDYEPIVTTSAEALAAQREYTKELKKRLDYLLSYHLHIPKEELEAFYNASDTEQAVIITKYSPYIN